jgi:hypothetical protein
MKRLTAAFFTLLCIHSSAQFAIDYRYLQSRVKDQSARGTCTAFAICAALEVQPGLPSDLSEQYLYSKAKFGHLLAKDGLEAIEDEMLEYYVDILQTNGVVSENKMPYDTAAVRYTSDKDMLLRFNDVTKGTSLYDMLKFDNVTYKLDRDAYEMYFGEEAQNIETIKSWLRKGIGAIPVSYHINTVAWGSVQAPKFIITPDSVAIVELSGNNYFFKDAKKISPDIVSGIKDSTVKIFPVYQFGFFDGGHAVTIVGYNQDGFIIKNSWGTGWGDKGYAVISYDYHALWCKKAMIINNFYVKNNFKAKAGDVYDAKEICLKTYPLLLSDNLTKALTLSFFYEGDKPAPEFTKIDIRFYTRNVSNGMNQDVSKSSVLITPDAYKSGYFSMHELRGFNWGTNKTLTAEVKFTLKGSNKVLTNTYPLIEWRNKTVRPGILNALLLDL